MKLSTMASLLGFCSLATAQLAAAPIVEQIAPDAKDCPADNKECRTAEQAAPWIAAGLFRYGVFNTKEMAAVIALMAFESTNFQWKHNVSPGRPGQGTANMQMANWNLQYAKSIDELKHKVADYESVDDMTDDQKNEVLALLTPDQYNFASGPWFLTTVCDKSVRELLCEDVDKGFKKYMEECVDVKIDKARNDYFQRAKKAFHLD